MTDPLVSVVMSVHNAERYLRQAIDSILAQSFHNFEFIIIDDGSTDSSWAIAEEFRTDIRTRLYKQNNLGLIASLNRGCKLARGKYVARMDADDVAVRDRLLWQVAFMESRPSIAVVGGSVDIIDSDGAVLSTYAFPADDREIKAGLYHGSCPLCHPAVLMRRDVVVSLGGYRRVVRDAEDYDLWLRVADHHNLANLARVVLRYRRHSAQVSVRKCSEQALTSLAARVAAAARRRGEPDVLDQAAEITPAVLDSLGIGEGSRKSALARGYLTCAGSMCEVGEYSVAWNVLETFRSLNWKNIENPVIADYLLLRATLYCRQRQFWKGLATLVRAIITRPKLIGRPLRPLLRQFAG